MRKLYLFFIIDPSEDKVIYQSDPFVANNEFTAEMKALRIADRELNDIVNYDFCLSCLGDLNEVKHISGWLTQGRRK